ncbi:phage terminase small subunit [Pseudomonas tohonis]|uniref:phage terminase small subunit n=1 Tax=Pseudomonas solani TaxID=2731552 RepID=UPI000396402B|nr:hypothetical protein L682_07305 [Pseudomonas alcaligenes OT 69]MDN4146621.1 phage terminase small subunit [Pseudomonas tohonis]
MSIALAHKRRVLAGESPKVPAIEPAYNPTDALTSQANAQKHLALQVAALDVDLERLSTFDSHEHRRLIKRDELLPKYLPYVQRYRESGLNYPNPVVANVLVWLFDTFQFEQGLELALFCIGQGQALPERFDRTVPTFVADTVIDWAEAEFKAGRSPEPYLSHFLPFVDSVLPGLDPDHELPLPTPWSLFERIPARYHKVLGSMAMDREEWALAVAHFQRAEALHPEIGVKTRREAAEKALRKQQADQAGNE